MDGGLEPNSSNDTNSVMQSPEMDMGAFQPVSTAAPTHGDEGSITWTASEFVAHKKGSLWYVAVILASLIVAGLIFLLTRDKISSIAIIVVAIILIFFGAKHPRELEYRIDKDGVHIGPKSFSFDLFRSFSTVHQGVFSSLVFYPLKRFSLLTSVYFDPLDEQKIVSIISSYLPLEERRRDIVDDLMWKIRF